MLATSELAEKIEFIYRELSALCKNINKSILNLNYEIRNDAQEFVVITYQNRNRDLVDITGLNKKSLTHRILEEF